MPESPGKLPRYVQRNFRLKAMGLVCVQLLSVLAIMAAVNATGFLQHRRELPGAFSTTFFVLVVSLIVALGVLSFLRATYPANYALLMLITVLAGLVWGVGGAVLPASLHFQLVGIMAVAMIVATALCVMLSQHSVQPRELVLGSVFTGWFLGCSLDWLVSPWLGASSTHVLIASAVTLLLYLVFICEVGRMLVQCNPDSFMMVVIAMDSTLLVIISIPMFWAVGLAMMMSCCLQAADDAEAPDAPEAPEAAAAGEVV